MDGNIMAATLTLLILIIHESGCDSRRSVCKRKLRERVKKANANTKYKLIGREENKKHTDILENERIARRTLTPDAKQHKNLFFN